MTDIICPLCGKPNPPELDECQYCQAPLKTGGFIAPPDSEQAPGEPITPPSPTSEEAEGTAESGPPSSLEQAIPDWLKATEASFLEGTESKPAEGGAEEPGSDQLSEQLDALLNPPQTPPKPREPAIDDEWLASLLAEAGAGEPEQPPSPEEPLAAPEPEGEAAPGQESETQAEPEPEEAIEEGASEQPLDEELPPAVPAAWCPFGRCLSAPASAAC